MTRRRLTIARLMAIIILVALGLTAFKYALRRPSHPEILFKRFALIGRIDMNRDNLGQWHRLTGGEQTVKRSSGRSASRATIAYAVRAAEIVLTH